MYHCCGQYVCEPIFDIVDMKRLLIAIDQDILNGKNGRMQVFLNVHLLRMYTDIQNNMHHLLHSARQFHVW